LADEDGFVYKSNINSVQEMANMMEATRSYQTNVEMMNTAKQLLMRTLTLGQ
jgi:flagellar basal-body rod protein FlgC